MELKEKIALACDADQAHTDAGQKAREMTLAEALKVLN